jgi:hypothetical protein
MPSAVAASQSAEAATAGAAPAADGPAGSAAAAAGASEVGLLPCVSGGLRPRPPNKGIRAGRSGVAERCGCSHGRRRGRPDGPAGAALGGAAVLVSAALWAW